MLENVALNVVAIASCCVVGLLVRLIDRMDESNRLLDEIADLLSIEDDDGGEPEDVPEPSAEKTNVIPIVRRTA